MSETNAVGIVTGHNARRYPSGSVLIHPTVRFQTPDDRTVEFESPVGSNVPPKVGEEVTVRYDPSRPEAARVAVGSAIRPNPKVLLIAGAIFLGAASLFFLLFVAVVVFVAL